MHHVDYMILNYEAITFYTFILLHYYLQIRAKSIIFNRSIRSLIQSGAVSYQDTHRAALTAGWSEQLEIVKI